MAKKPPPLTPSPDIAASETGNSINIGPELKKTVNPFEGRFGDIRVKEVVECWPGYFSLSLLYNGSYAATAIGALANRFEALTICLDAKTMLIMEALRELQTISQASSRALDTAIDMKQPKAGSSKFLVELPENLALSLEKYIVVVRNLKIALGPDLNCIRPWRKSEAEQGIKRVIKACAAATQALSIDQFSPKLRPGTRTFPIRYCDRDIQAPLPWLAIEFARVLVKETRRLPTKAEVRARLVAAHPDLKKQKHPFWSEVYLNAGLSGLDSAAPWDEVKKKKAKAREAKRELNQP